MIESILATLSKIDCTTYVSPLRFWSLKKFQKFSARYLCLFFSNKVASLKSLGCNFTENNKFDRNT